MTASRAIKFEVRPTRLVDNWSVTGYWVIEIEDGEEQTYALQPFPSFSTREMAEEKARFMAQERGCPWETILEPI